MRFQGTPKDRIPDEVHLKILVAIAEDKYKGSYLGKGMNGCDEEFLYDDGYMEYKRSLNGKRPDQGCPFQLTAKGRIAIIKEK